MIVDEGKGPFVIFVMLFSNALSAFSSRAISIRHTFCFAQYMPVSILIALVISALSQSVM